MNQKNQLSKEKFQEKYLELQHINELLKRFNQQISLLENQLLELKLIEESLLEILKVEKEHETFITLGPGVYTKGMLKKTDTILLNVGSGVVIEKKTHDALNFIRKQSSETERLILSLQEQAQESFQTVESLQRQLSDFLEEENL